MVDQTSLPRLFRMGGSDETLEETHRDSVKIKKRKKLGKAPSASPEVRKDRAKEANSIFDTGKIQI
jgi:hypothetical protein